MSDSLRSRLKGLQRVLAIAVLSLTACAPLPGLTASDATTLPLPPGMDIEDIADILPTQPQFREFTPANPPTFTEYKKAMFATSACVESVGLEVRGPALSTDPDNPARSLTPGIPTSEIYGFSARWPTSGVQPRMGVESGLDFCSEWSSLNKITIARSPSEESVRAWYDQLRACMKEDGAEGVDDLTELELLEAAYVPYLHCAP